MPDATAEAKEEAYENLQQLIGVLVRINDRLRNNHKESREVC